MLCVVIKGPLFSDAYRQVGEALLYADLIELRLDYFTSLSLTRLKEFCSQFALPMIFTLRSQLDGGGYKQSEEKRLAQILVLAELLPAYLDLEHRVSSDFIREIAAHYPSIRLIRSYHDCIKTPEYAELEAIYAEMQDPRVSLYKIAAHANHHLDAMRLLCWNRASDPALIAISMGPLGGLSRILGPIVQNPITYAFLEEPFHVQLLVERYRHYCLSPKTAIYGLIGNPIGRSIGDETHNQWFALRGLDAVYVKIQLDPSDLAEFLSYAKQLGFKGLSVTMPLKEAILPYLDACDSKASEIGAVNTVVFEEDRILGYNTDGAGALDALERELDPNNLKVAIMGTGGTAKAIAHEALCRGACVTILGRNAEKALQIAEKLGCASGGESALLECDLLINCTPVSPSIDSVMLSPHVLLMDVRVKPEDNAFLNKGRAKGCRTLDGLCMFFEQAAGQQRIWFKLLAQK